MREKAAGRKRALKISKCYSDCVTRFVRDPDVERSIAVLKSLEIHFHGKENPDVRNLS